jgi:hypothetical protein
LTSHRDRVPAGWLLLETFLSRFHDLVQGGNVDLPIFPLEVAVDDRVQLPHNLPQFRVEVVLDAVVALPRDLRSYQRPFVSHLVVQLHQFLLLLS